MEERGQRLRWLLFLSKIYLLLKILIETINYYYFI